MGSEPVQSFAELMRGALRILVFTGAGISTGSGIPDYRGPNGVWKTHAPVFYRDFMASEELEKAGKLLAVVTQNIDGLHGRAGVSRELIVELHGTMHEVECQSCRRREEPGPRFEEFHLTGKPPSCGCGGFLKPATISFGQSLRHEDLARAFETALRADLVVALGSTLSVTPAANVPLEAASRGAFYVIVNRGPTEHDRLPEVTLRLEGDVVFAVPPRGEGGARAKVKTGRYGANAPAAAVRKKPW